MTIDCQMRKGDCCQLVSELASVPLELAKVTDNACGYCIRQGSDRPVNYVTISVSISTLHRNGMLHPKKHKYLLTASASQVGPGKFLSESLSWIAKPDEGDCYCKSRAAIMDIWGPDKCEEKIETIVGWLIEGAEKYGVDWAPVAVQSIVARAMIREAIRKSRDHAKTIQ